MELARFLGAVFCGLVICTTFTASTVFAGKRLHFKAAPLTDPSVLSRQNLLFQRWTQGTAGKNYSYYVIQFRETPSFSVSEELRHVGVDVLGYIPEDAYLVRVSSSLVLRAISASPSVEFVSPYLETWRKSPSLQSLMGDSVPVLVRLFSAEDRKPIVRAISLLDGVRITESKGRILVVNLPRSLIDKIATLEGVEWVEPLARMETMDWKALPGDDPSAMQALSGTETGTQWMGFPSAWAQGLSGLRQLIAVVDTGLDTGDLSSLDRDFSGLLQAFILTSDSQTWADSNGHGTHVAGSAVGTGLLSGGSLKGGAFGAQLLMGSVLTTDGSFDVPADPNSLFGLFYGEGARIHSNSWGTVEGLGEYDSFAAMVDEFIWEHPDLFVLFAAGNSGVDVNSDGVIDTDSISSPGTAKNVLTVGASENVVEDMGVQGYWGEGWRRKYSAEPMGSDLVSDNAGGMAAFSSRGPTDDGRIKPDVIAPGTNILSARSHHPDAHPLWGAYNQDYVFSGGTSMSTPLAAGAAAVIRQYLMEKLGQNEPSSSLIKAVFLHTAKDLFPGQYGFGVGQEIPSRRPNGVEGFGRVDVAAATRLGTAKIVDEKLGVRTGEIRSYDFYQSRPGPLRFTMVYTDAPALVTSSEALVNDLDLEIVAPDGTVSAPLDRVNNLEMVEVRAAPAGDYTVRVKGEKIVKGRAGKQSFALIIGP